MLMLVGSFIHQKKVCRKYLFSYIFTLPNYLQIPIHNEFAKNGRYKTVLLESRTNTEKMIKFL
jgi:hypothetical protein